MASAVCRISGFLCFALTGTHLHLKLPIVMKLRPAVGVLVGGVSDIVATNILTLPLFVYIASVSDLSSTSTGAGPAVFGALQASAGLQAVAWMLGLVATILGGYVAALIARSAHVGSGALSSWLCVASGVYGMVAGVGGGPLWQHILAFILSPTFGALGGYLRLRQVQRSLRRLEAKP